MSFFHLRLTPPALPIVFLLVLPNPLNVPISPDACIHPAVCDPVRLRSFPIEEPTLKRNFMNANHPSNLYGRMSFHCAITNSIFILIRQVSLRKIAPMHREQEPRIPAAPSGRTFDAYEELRRRGMNHFLLCCVVCEIERIWKMKPGSDRKALAKLKSSPKRIQTIARSLKDEADELEKLHTAGFVQLGDSSEWIKSFLVQMRSVSNALTSNCGLYPRNVRQNIHAAALVKLIGEAKDAAEEAGAIYKHNEFPIKKLASDLMRQGVPEDILEKVRANFLEATAQIKDFPNSAALKQRILKLARKYDDDVADLCHYWRTTFSYQPHTWGDRRTAQGPVPPLTMLHESESVEPRTGSKSSKK